MKNSPIVTSRNESSTFMQVYGTEHFLVCFDLLDRFGFH